MPVALRFRPTASASSRVATTTPCASGTRRAARSCASTQGTAPKSPAWRSSPTAGASPPPVGTGPREPRLDLPPRRGASSRPVGRGQVFGHDAFVALRQRLRVQRVPLSYDGLREVHFGHLQPAARLGQHLPPSR